MKYKILTRRATLLVYEENDPVNYTAACQININGRHGTIDTLLGTGFYKFLSKYGYKPFKDLGLVEVSAGVTRAHLRLLRRELNGIGDINIEETGEPVEIDSGIQLHWIRMTEKSPQE